MKISTVTNNVSHYALAFFRARERESECVACNTRSYCSQELICAVRTNDETSGQSAYQCAVATAAASLRDF